jgi:hypothetical protein
MEIIGVHPNSAHPYGESLSAANKTTDTGVPHRALTGNGKRQAFMNYTLNALKFHHKSPEALERIRKTIAALRINGVDTSRLSPYPKNKKTQRGNYAEIVLAEYLEASTTVSLPIYRLRYNPNPDQSMKGDDVLMFDLDSKPIRVIIGESKFRKTPDKAAVEEIVEGLTRSNTGVIPASLTFVADRLFNEGRGDLGQRVLDCAELFMSDRLDVSYVGFLMSNTNAGANIDRSTESGLHNLLMISLGVDSPEVLVDDAFQRLEQDL